MSVAAEVAIHGREVEQQVANVIAQGIVAVLQFGAE